ncbi:MAG: reverse transcriptase family protein, partial [Candidatus Thiodiazotropha endolucinida]|nr:reverse transcriptase family protein [Candidatus Thiodiazotropha taylori]MCW4346033.1 reverse transcriptase family protein [Candidatus Thiodiazotropha endolucinida]
MKDLHAGMRQARRLWIAEGRPRGSTFVTYRNYKRSKAIFRSYHRKCAQNYLYELNNEIDKAAEIDSAYFWKKINYRRKLSISHAGNEIEFNGRIRRDPEDIANGWGEYFQQLYSDTERQHFDSSFKEEVDERVEHIQQELLACQDRDPFVITAEHVRSFIRPLKTSKACGKDGIYNEHLLHGGNNLAYQLSLLYTDMYNCGYIPDTMKKGIIITLHKGGRKSKKDPNNYRAITLTSSVLKLFERILLSFIENTLSEPLNSLQGGFRPTVGCNMTSLMLKECIMFAKERHSKLFVCFLDVQKAFDKVWHNGLFLKLYNMGIKSKLLRVVIDLHSNLMSSVFHNGYNSHWFPVLQGTRQGGVISPLMYLCYVNDLLNELCTCDLGFKMFGECFVAPTVCDDMVLLALSKLGLDTLMDICFRYACKWRYEYSPAKSSIIVFNETRPYFGKIQRNWYLGPNNVDEAENYKHLGVDCSKYLELKVNLKACVDKLKGTFMSIANCGLMSDFNPLSCKKIYNTVVLPKALYGCETWNPLRSNDILFLERAHRFCVKFMQGLNIRTRTDVALSLLGVYSIESEIDFRKLNLLGQLCRVKSNSWLKLAFLSRLASYNVYKDIQLGFIPEIVRILDKYDLKYYLDAFLQNNVFPNRLTWKRLVKHRIHSNEINLWQARLSSPELHRFSLLHNEYIPHRFWIISYEHPRLMPCYKSVVQMIASVSNNFTDQITCFNCGVLYENIVDHCLHDCLYVEAERLKLWLDIYQLCPEVYAYMRCLDKEDLSLIFLGAVSDRIASLFGER